MAYEVTATRRRPGTFDELVGQEFVQATLKNSIDNGRIAHAYLFSGPRGCGKTSTARILAKTLNCQAGKPSEPCGACPSCVSIAKGSALDVIEIDGASNTSVENVRQIKDEVLFPPNSSKYKIYIIDEVHMLSNSAFNALLKTIEEPPPYIVFIFATTELHKVPATIKSRCQHFNFRLVPAPVVRDLLREASSELGVLAEDEALLWIAKESTGSIRDAYTLFDQVVAFSSGEITMEKIKEKLALVGLDDLNALSERCVSCDCRGALEFLDTLLSKGISVEQLAVDLCEYWRSVLLTRQGVSGDFVLGYPSERYSEAVVRGVSPSQAERALSLMLDLYRDLRFSVNPRFELELAVSRLCSIKRHLSVGDIGVEIVSLKKTLVSGTPARHERHESAVDRVIPVSEPTVAIPVPEQMRDARGETGSPPEAESPTQPGAVPEIVALRQAVIAKLRKTRAMVAASLEKSREWELGGETIVIPFKAEYEADIVRQDVSSIASIVQSLTGRPFKVSLKADPPPKKAEPEPVREEDDEDGAEGDPIALIQTAFRGTKIGEQQLGGEN